MVYVVEGINQLLMTMLYLHQLLDDSHFWQSNVVGDTAFSICG